MPSVIIIGAGPAGSLAAILLARAGWSVDLIEQSRYPRHKVCGECLSSLGVDLLQRHGLSPPQKISLARVILHAPDGTSAATPLPEPMWGVSRHLLDAHLLSAAREAGAQVHQPTRAALPNLETQPGRPSLQESQSSRPLTAHLHHLDDNTKSVLHADWVLLADGRGAALAPRPAATDDFGLKAHFTGVDAPTDAIGLFGVDGHYGGVSPVENNRHNLAFSVPRRLIDQSHGDLEAVFGQILAQNRTLAEQFRRAQRQGRWLCSPLPRFAVRPHWPNRVIPLGNAAAALEPVGGEGMGLALRSAELATLALRQWECHPSDAPAPIEALKRQFASLWRTRSLACRGVARLLSRPALAPSIIQMMQFNPPLARSVMAWMGKSRAAIAPALACAPAPD